MEPFSLANVKPINLKSKYYVGNPLGSGGQATVLLGKCRDNILPGGFVALKVHKVDRKNLFRIQKEIRIHKHLNNLHRNENEGDNVVNHIVQLHEVIRGVQCVTCVLEYCDGKDLLDNIRDEGNKAQPFSEELAASTICVMANILSSLKQHGIIHRDLKPENFVYKISSNGTKILKLIDFGLACLESDPVEVKSEYVGTPGYIAPEIYQGLPASSASDVWSLGVILFILLTATMPFDGTRTKSQLQHLEENMQFSFKEMHWPNGNNERVQDLIKSMLAVENRISISAILTHRWLNIHTRRSKEQYDLSYHNRMQAIKGQHKFGKTVALMLRTRKWMSRAVARVVANKDLQSKERKTRRESIEVLLNNSTNTPSVAPEPMPMSMELNNDAEMFPVDAGVGSIDVSIDLLYLLLSRFKAECSTMLAGRVSVSNGLSDIVDLPMSAMEPQSTSAKKRKRHEDLYLINFEQYHKVISAIPELSLFSNRKFFQSFCPRVNVYHYYEDTEAYNVYNRIDYRKFLLSVATYFKTSMESSFEDDRWTRYCFSLFDATRDDVISKDEFASLAGSFIYKGYGVAKQSPVQCTPFAQSGSVNARKEAPPLPNPASAVWYDPYAVLSNPNPNYNSHDPNLLPIPPPSSIGPVSSNILEFSSENPDMPVLLPPSTPLDLGSSKSGSFRLTNSNPNPTESNVSSTTSSRTSTSTNCFIGGVGTRNVDQEEEYIQLLFSFSFIDTSQSGTIDYQEFKTWIKQLYS